MTKNEYAAPSVIPIDAEFNIVATENVDNRQVQKPSIAQALDTPPEDGEEAFFSRMPPEFFDELRRRAELARTQPNIPIAEARRRLSSIAGAPDTDH